MKENLKLGLILLMITSIAGIALGLANAVTKDAIAMNSQISVEEVATLLPGAEAVKTSKLPLDENIVEVMEAYDAKDIIGYIIKLTSPGFHGNIEMLVGINNEGVETGIKIISHGETPGVGSKIENQEFQEGFRNKPIDKELTLVKNQSSSDNEIQGITGATISSAAVVSGVNTAINYYKSTVLGEEIVTEEPGINLDKLNLTGGEVSSVPSSDVDLIKELNEVKIDGSLAAYILVSEVKGAYSEISVATAVDVNTNAILGVQIIAQGETPGLGDSICNEEFTSKFQGLSAAGEAQVDVISGATISSEAVIKAVNNALDYYNNNINR